MGGMNLSRRRFLQRGAAAGALLATGGPWIHAQSRDPLLRTALIGCGWWGNNILGEAMASRACRITALCDPDEVFLNRTADRVREETGQAARRYRDYRELLEKEKPEIVIIATPDHWHALQTIAAVQAGAHVFVEKPICHTLDEGKAMVAAARAADRTVVVDMHRRVSPHNLSALEFIRSGQLGQVGMVRAFVAYGGGPEKPRPNTEPPATLDWDLWCGPAPMRPYNGDPENPWSGGIHPRGFRNYLDYANGMIGDWGIHWFDQVLWMMEAEAPSRVYATGGRPVRGPAVLTTTEQTSDAPDSMSASFRFDAFTLTWEHRQFGGNPVEKGENVGCHFFGTKGVLHLGWRNGWTFFPSNERQPEIHESPKLHPPDDQNIRELWAAFLEAVRTGNRPVCDIEDGYRATAMSLLGMLSWRLGRSVDWDAGRGECPGDSEANALLKRDYRPGWVYPSS